MHTIPSDHVPPPWRDLPAMTEAAAREAERAAWAVLYDLPVRALLAAQRMRDYHELALSVERDCDATNNLDARLVDAARNPRADWED